MRALAIGPLLFAVLLAGCSGANAADDVPAVQVNDVAIHGMQYAPRTMMMASGDSLRFENHETRMHTATAVASPMGDLDSGDLALGETHVFEGMQPGTYTFTCKHHADMRLTVTVTA
ncbi:MAG: cupredoxin domain-containing protein [Candidatus Thermoplasmatota archaeon]